TAGWLFKGTKGGGKLTDGPNCLIDNPGADPAFNTCASAALTAAETMSSGTTAIVLAFVKTALNAADNDLLEPPSATTASSRARFRQEAARCRFRRTPQPRPASARPKARRPR